MVRVSIAIAIRIAMAIAIIIAWSIIIAIIIEIGIGIATAIATAIGIGQITNHSDNSDIQVTATALVTMIRILTALMHMLHTRDMHTH